MSVAHSFGMARRQMAALALLCTALLVGHAGAAPPARVAVVLSAEGGAYAEVAEAIRSGLARDGGERFRVAIMDAGTVTGALEADPATLVVTVGMRAASAVQEIAPRTPVLYTLVPKAALDRLLAAQKGGAKRSGIYLDQPLERQLELIKLIIPAATRVGVIFGPDSVKQASALESVAASIGLKVEAEAVTSSEQVAVALRRVLERGEVLLGLPDPEVFNQATVHNLLLAAYRAGDPVFAFSPAYIKAGALAGVFSSSGQIGMQAAEMIAKLAGQAAWPEPQYPKYFTVTVNQTVARSMGIPIEEERALHQKLQPVAGAGS